MFLPSALAIPNQPQVGQVFLVFTAAFICMSGHSKKLQQTQEPKEAETAQKEAEI